MKKLFEIYEGCFLTSILLRCNLQHTNTELNHITSPDEVDFKLY